MKKAMVIRKTGVMGLGELGDFSQAGRANLPEVYLFIFELLFVPTIHFSDQYRISPQSSSFTEDLDHLQASQMEAGGVDYEEECVCH